MRLITGRREAPLSRASKADRISGRSVAFRTLVVIFSSPLLRRPLSLRSAPQYRGQKTTLECPEQGVRPASARGSAFAAVIVDAARPRADEPIACGRPGGAAMIEIVIGAATVRVSLGIDAATLTTVLRAVKAAT